MNLVAIVRLTGAAPSPAGNGVSTAALTRSGTISDATYSWSTSKNWKGSCRVLVANLADGSVRRLKVHFQ